MRVTSLISAAAFAGSALALMAQSNVYSPNVVGYVNLHLTAGFNLVANQLDVDGTGTNNTVRRIFGLALPPGAVWSNYFEVN